MGLLKKAFHLVGPVLLVVILIKFVDAPTLTKTVSGALLSFLALSCIFNFLMYAGKVYRIHYLLKEHGISVRFFALSKMYAYCNFLGQLSNMLVSDIANAGILMADNRNRLAISNIFIASRIADLIFVISICLVTLFLNRELLFQYVTIDYTSLVVLATIGIICLATMLLLRARALVFLRSFAATVGTHFAAIVAITAAAYAFNTASAFCDMKTLGLEMPLSYLIFMYALGTLITVLPLSVGGIGTRDIAFIFLVGLLQLPAEKAVVLSFIGFILVPYISLCMLYFCSLIGVAYENRHNR